MKFKFEGNCLEQEDKATFTSNIVVNFFIIYELDSWPRYLNTDFTVEGCLFGVVKFTKIADPEKYVYSGYGVGFDTQIEYSLPDGSVGKDAIIFGADMSSSVNIDNEIKGILILGKGKPQGLNYQLIAEALYSV